MNLEMNERKFRKWCEKNLKSEEERNRRLIIHEKLERKYREIKYFLYVMENHEGSKWVALESDLTQFQDWELKLLNALKHHFDLVELFLYYDSRYYQDHKPILYQIDFLDGIAEEQIDFLYNLCHKGPELVNKKIEYFNRVLNQIEKFNIQERKRMN